MIEKFSKALAAALSAAGFEASVDKYTDNLVVSGCSFEVSKVDDDVVRLNDESSFKVQKDGSFNIERAVGIIVKRLPARLEAKRLAEKEREYKALIRETWTGEEVTVQRTMYATITKLEPGLALAATGLGVMVTVVLQDADKIQRLIDAATELLK